MSAILLGTILVRMATGQAGDPTDPSAENGATDVVIARVIDRRVDRDDADPDWDRRTFTYTLMIEAVEQGAFERNQEIQVGAFRTTWTGAEDAKPAFDPGCEPLPLEGERARFSLVRNDDGVSILNPNGVELADGADPTDPVRIGDPPRPQPEPEVDETAEPEKKDPFGWDIILVLLGLPFLIGAIKQKEPSRWGLLVVACLLFLSAALVAIL